MELTIVYVKTAFQAYAGYVQEIPEIDSVRYSLDEVKGEIRTKLDILKEESGLNYQTKEVYK